MRGGGEAVGEVGHSVDRSVGLVQRTVLRGSFIQFALSVSMSLPR